MRNNSELNQYFLINKIFIISALHVGAMNDKILPGIPPSVSWLTEFFE